MKKVILSFLSIICLLSVSNGQPANPFVNITGGSGGIVQVGSTTTLDVFEGNFGDFTICHSSLEIVITVGLNVEILGIASGDTRWVQTNLTSGAGNTIYLRNNNGGFADYDVDHVYLTIKGVAILDGGPRNCVSNIGYIVANNQCAPGPNAAQGDADPNDNSNITSFTVTAVTPLHFTAFNANGKDCGARVTWSTAQEENVKQFELQQSFDGNNYHTIATTLSKGAGAHDYSLEVNQAQKRMYYRIVAVDVDGRKLYSNVSMVQLNNCTKASLVQVFPIPANRDEMINMRANQNEIVNYRVLDMSGKQVLSGRFFNNSQIKLATGGSYLIEFIGKSFKETQKILVQ